MGAAQGRLFGALLQFLKRRSCTQTVVSSADQAGGVRNASCMISDRFLNGSIHLSGSPRDRLWTLQGLRILIVDDFAQMRTMLREMLVSSGADDIESVKNGEEALEAMSRRKPDIVLCDYNLGDGKDGQQVLEEAREHDWLPYSCIFILITAENTLEMVMGVVEHEPDAYLTKPFTRVVLQQRLRRLQEKKRRFAEIAHAVEHGEFMRACLLCDKAIASGDRYRFDLMRIKGDALLRAGDFAAAEKHYQHVLALRELPWAQLGLGRSLCQLGRWTDAVQVLEQAIKAKENFVAAHDWLARAQQALGKLGEAEQTLQRAVKLSPKNLRRQKALGDTALQNGHLEVAEQAFSQVLREGRNSIFGSPSDYGAMSRIYLAGDQADKAERVLGRMHRSYQRADPALQLKMAVVDGHVHAALGHEEESKAAMHTALKLFEHSPESLDREEAMSLAETCLVNGDNEAAAGLIQHVVRANHEDDAMLARAQDMFARVGLAEEGQKIIAAERKRLIQLNNEAVQLAKDGELKASVGMLLKAAHAMPDNVAINLNAAQSLLMLMQQEQCNWRMLRQAQDLLRRTQATGAGKRRHGKLMALAQSMEKTLQ